ncbi:Molybdenum cofactor synthesis protein 1 [Mortierella claussenii]|nr:Molybdenum cofactor synthesis protein 1 [Mortierella claussenii]
MTSLRMSVATWTTTFSTAGIRKQLSQRSASIVTVQAMSATHSRITPKRQLRAVHSSCTLFSDSLPSKPSLSPRQQSPSSATSSAGDAPQLTHTDPKTGKASMVSVTDKPATHRTALAVSSIWLPGVAFDLLKRNAHKKGDVLTVAQIAGIQAAKQTSNLIPLCHPLLLTHVTVDLKLVEDQDQGQDQDQTPDRDMSTNSSETVLRGGRVEIQSKVACLGNTGVEMEALTGATVAALTVFDMCKAVGKDMVIGEIKVVEKTGGKSGLYRHQQQGSDRRSPGI